MLCIGARLILHRDPANRTGLRWPTACPGGSRGGRPAGPRSPEAPPGCPPASPKMAPASGCSDASSVRFRSISRARAFCFSSCFSNTSPGVTVPYHSASIISMLTPPHNPKRGPGPDTRTKAALVFFFCCSVCVVACAAYTFPPCSTNQYHNSRRKSRELFGGRKKLPQETWGSRISEQTVLRVDFPEALENSLFRDVPPDLPSRRAATHSFGLPSCQS